MSQHANINASVGVFFDSFAKIAISIAVLIYTIKLPTSIVYLQLLPGICVTLFILGVAYYLQAVFLKKHANKLITALPNGLQSSCVFVWLFAIMLPITFKTHNPILGYKVALLANLLNAIFFMVSGFIIIKIKKYIPTTALFTGLAGTAFTWLAINNLPHLFAHPLSGLLPFLLILGLHVANIKIKIPIMLLGVLAGSIIAGFNHEIMWSLAGATKHINLIMPSFITLDISRPVVSLCIEYMPLIMAFAIIDAISTIQILEEARLSDDMFNPHQSILISGIISGLSAFIGNPFAVALFFGHSSWKKLGATEKYVLYNAFIYLILGLSGSLGLLTGFIPDWVILPILIIIGVNTAAISFKVLNPEEYIILVIGMIPIIMELIFNKLQLLAVQYNMFDIMKQAEYQGMLTMAKGSVLFSMIFTSALYYLKKHQWLSVAGCCTLLSLFTSIGFIHFATPGVYFFSQINYLYIICILICLLAYFFDKNCADKNESIIKKSTT